MKRFISLLLCLLLLSAAAFAYAEGQTKLQLFDCSQADDTLQVLLYANDGAAVPLGFSVTYGGTELPVTGLQSLEEAECGSSWVVIVEPATWQSIANTVSSFIKALINQLGRNDNMAVIDAVSGEMTQYVSDSATLMPFVEKALSGRGDVKLYDAIQTAYTSLSTDAAVNRRQCLVILSECTDTNSSTTLYTLRNTAEKSPVTVYTVGFIRTPTYLAGYQEVSTLSSMSASGLTFYYDNFDKNTGAEISQRILENERCCLVLSADLSGLEGGRSYDAPLSVFLRGVQGDAEQTMEDVHVETPEGEHVHEWGDNATCEHPRSCVICGEYDPDGEPVDHEYENGKCIWCGEYKNKAMGWIKENPAVCVLGAVLLALVIALAVILGRRKQQAAPAPASGIEDFGPTRPSKGKGKVTIELINKVSGKKFVGNIRGETIRAGRTSELALTGDPSISREHMEFVWQNGILYLQNISKTNETRVNGTEIKGAVPLHQSDVIHAGNSDFIVTWRSNS